MHTGVYISCGYSWSMVIVSNGHLYAWGHNSNGQLGFMPSQYHSVPMKVPLAEGIVIVKVACGYSHTLALSQLGQVFSWGSNNHGQLGISKQQHKTSIIKTVELPFVNDIETMYCSNMSVARAGTLLYVWGECMGQQIAVPTRVLLNSVHDVFASFTCGGMPRPLIYHGEVLVDITNSFANAFNDSTTSDLTIKVDGQPIFVHKAILKIRSEYFRMMFREHWMENGKSVIEHNTFSYNVYKAFLKYLYTGRLNLSIEDAIEILQLAKMYTDQKLESVGEQCIRSGVTWDNVAYVYEKAIENNFTDLENFCFSYAKSHMNYVVQTPSFLALSQEAMKRFIVRAGKEEAFQKE